MTKMVVGVNRDPRGIHPRDQFGVMSDMLDHPVRDLHDCARILDGETVSRHGVDPVGGRETEQVRFGDLDHFVRFLSF